LEEDPIEYKYMYLALLENPGNLGTYHYTDIGFECLNRCGLGTEDVSNIQATPYLGARIGRKLHMTAIDVVGLISVANWQSNGFPALPTLCRTMLLLEVNPIGVNTEAPPTVGEIFWDPDQIGTSMMNPRNQKRFKVLMEEFTDVTNNNALAVIDDKVIQQSCGGPTCGKINWHIDLSDDPIPVVYNDNVGPGADTSGKWVRNIAKNRLWLICCSNTKPTFGITDLNYYRLQGSAWVTFIDY